MAVQSTRLDPVNYPEAPSNLTLEQVHVYVRHGERTPVGVRMSDPPASIPEHWLLCQAGRKFSAAVWDSSMNNELRTSTVKLERVTEFRNGSSKPGVCMLGELTDVGRESTHEFGKALRKLYIERLGLLPDLCEDPASVYYRSTNVPRTIESLQQIINGLYPDSKRKSRTQLLVRNAKDENIIPNHFSCKKLERLAVAFSQAAAENLNPTLKPLDKRLSRYLNGEPVRIDGKPRASGILDTIRAAKAHGFRVPHAFNDPEVMDLIEYAVVTEWFGGYKSLEYRRLAMGPLLDDLQSKMQKRVDEGERESPNLLVYSTHDTALAGLLSSLDVFDHRWPEFTAFVTFELFKQEPLPPVQRASFLGLNFNWGRFIPSNIAGRQVKDVGPSEHFVRLRYQNKNLALPFCARDGDHLSGFPEFCTLSAFKAHVKELTPEDWDEECLPPKAETTL
ncbi:hypothetical protein M408DRAFT_325425 [Serendipita vermifera MAFF 305830]|uniref:Acid phosphatase n=1 Tax=Serendipita vermifera MAFF 305830 TaxID=933852 RepID=A0A0C3BAJ4_SERVB|nr:hypothetical protein M408DRAFT_325425 [Serendipita vermifera MAFF 305830]